MPLFCIHVVVGGFVIVVVAAVAGVVGIVVHLSYLIAPCFEPIHTAPLLLFKAIEVILSVIRPGS